MMQTTALKTISSTLAAVAAQVQGQHQHGLHGAARRRTTTLIASSVLLGLALAGPTTQAAKIDCATLVAAPSWDLKYREVEVFPDPANKTAVDLYLLKTPFHLAQCGVVIDADAQKYSITAKGIDVMGQVLGWERSLRGVSGTGATLGYPDAVQVSINLPNGLSSTNVGITNYFSGQYLPADALIAVRPLLYNGSIRSTVEVSAELKTLDLFIKSSKPVLWERLTLDAEHSKMTSYKKATLPAK